MKCTYIDNKEEFELFLSKIDNLKEIAVDFECEFNLHIYGEHLCIIQIFDGTSYYIIDAKAKGLDKEDLIRFLTHPVEKIWFDVQSDNSLVNKIYNVQIANVYDIRAVALAWGFVNNLTLLTETYLNLESKIENKKKLQKTNWLLRPLSDAQMEYALSDVENLIKLKYVLLEEVKEKGIEENVKHNLAKACQITKSKPGWMKLGNWRKMSKEQKDAMKEYFIARDNVASRFNTPAYRVLDKHLLIELAMANPNRIEDVYSLAAPFNYRYEKFLKEALAKAFSKLKN